MIDKNDMIQEYNFHRRQKAMDQDEINKSIANKITANSTADIVAKQIYDAIIAFQSMLSDREEVGIAKVGYFEDEPIAITAVKSIGYSLVVFHGVDKNGKPVVLVQHISQISIALVSIDSPKSEGQHRPIGFQIEMDD